MSAADDSRADQSGLSVFGVLSILFRYRKAIVGFPIVGFALAVALIVWQGRTYVSSAAFLAQARQDLRSGLSGIASQLGLPIPMSQPGDSPAFYAELLQSRVILDSVVRATYRFTVQDVAYEGNLAELFEVSGKTPALRHEAAVKELRDQITVTKGRETSLVSLAVETRYAPLSYLIARRLLELLNEYNLQRRQSQAAAESRFINRRLAEAEKELRATEDKLQTFLQANREYRNSPQLSFQQERLERDVTMRQTVYTTLTQLYEQARIEEVRDTPVITIVEPPAVPVKYAPRGWITKGLVGLIAGGILGVFTALLLGFLDDSRRASPEEFRRYVGLRDEALRGLRRPFRGRAATTGDR